MSSAAEPETTSPLKAAIPAWLMSLVLHVTVLTVGAVFFRVVPRGVEEPGRGVGIVLTQASASGSAEYFSDGGEAGGPSASGSPLTGGATNAAPSSAVALPGPEQLPETSGPKLPTGAANAGLPGDESGLPGAT